MKQLAILILGLSILSLAFKEWVVISSFMVNRDTIAAQYCVEKDNPRSCCKGSCYLSSSLQDVNDEENSALIQETDQILHYLLPKLEDNVLSNGHSSRILIFGYSPWSDRLYAKEWLDPPQQKTPIS